MRVSLMTYPFKHEYVYLDELDHHLMKTGLLILITGQSFALSRKCKQQFQECMQPNRLTQIL